MKAGKKIMLALVGILVISIVLPLSGCAFLGIEKSDDESVGAVSSLDGSVDKRIYKEAQRIVNSLQKTGYQSEPEVRESSGTYLFDSAGLVNYVLGRVAPNNFARIANGVDGALTPEHYYYYFTGLDALNKAPENGWCRIVSLANARPGDILVIEHKQTGQNEAGGSDHILIIVDTPVPADNIGYSVLVVDAALSGHDNDTRDGDGVGKGVIYFGLDPNGAPINYRWSDPLAAPFTQGLVGIAIGRAG